MKALELIKMMKLPAQLNQAQAIQQLRHFHLYYMADETQTIEEERRMNYLRAVNGRQLEEENGSGSVVVSADAEGVAGGQWLLMFMAATLVWLLGLLIDLVIPFITFLMNYLVVGGIWFWAKTRGLKPPTFSSVAKKAGAVATKVVGAKDAESALDAVPGSDLAYIALGGITPIIYLAALWWNNSG